MNIFETLQQRLKDAGFYQGAIDGKIGPLTVQAMNSALDKVIVNPASAKLEPKNSNAASARWPKQGKNGLRKVHTLVFHCTATPEGREFTVGDIDKMHRARGFNGIGYHKLIHLDGRVSEGRPESQVGAHVAGHNTGTLGYSYVGGVDKNGKAKDTRTPEQKATMKQLAVEAIANYGLKKIVGHRDLSPDKDMDGVVEPNEWVKQCPCFDAVAEYKELLA